MEKLLQIDLRSAYGQARACLPYAWRAMFDRATPRSMGAGAFSYALHRANGRYLATVYATPCQFEPKGRKP